MATKKTESKTSAKPKAEKKEAVVTKTSKPASTVVITDDEIAQRAYEIHLETGNHDAHENWLEAEKQLKKKK
ncbi:MAG: hypothetical protein A2033_06535 [Bacteroidetes bacterium GWA2_31_9]|nr:MAG: hypothetical protein A2033_06535 [Bacteroidetes bacterium GWA2_31_9]